MNDNVAQQILVHVHASTRDGSWRGEISPWQAAEPMYCYDTIFIGRVTYSVGAVIDGVKAQVFGNPSGQLGVLGHLTMIGEAVLSEGIGRVGSYDNEWEMGVEVDGVLVVLSPMYSEPLSVARTALCQGVSEAVDDTIALIEVATERPRWPLFLVALEHLNMQLRSRC